MKLTAQAALAREAALQMQAADTEKKNGALRRAAALLGERAGDILAANAKDLTEALERGMNPAFVERLTLSDQRIAAMAKGLIEVADLKDPVGEVLEAWRRPNGLLIRKVRVPIGVIAIIYESAPT
jgi:glutamate-5-semialdehyde dehydrogenase